jgi:hypothetical protein
MWAKDKKNPDAVQASSTHPFKFEGSSLDVVNALPKSLRFLFPLRRE